MRWRFITSWLKMSPSADYSIRRADEICRNSPVGRVTPLRAVLSDFQTACRGLPALPMRVRSVGRITACPERSRMGARRVSDFQNGVSRHVGARRTNSSRSIRQPSALNSRILSKYLIINYLKTLTQVRAYTTNGPPLTSP